jgi:hypothetical protein
MLSEAFNLARKLRNGAIPPTVLFFLGMTRANLGRISDAFSTLNEALEMAERNNDAIYLVRAPNGIRWVHREVQNFQHPIPDDRSRESRIELIAYFQRCAEW